MTFNQLKESLKNGPRAVQWTKSQIVEIASLEKNGAVRITNIISDKSYILPRKNSEWILNLIPEGDWIKIGNLSPRDKK